MPFQEQQEPKSNIEMNTYKLSMENIEIHY